MNAAQFYAAFDSGWKSAAPARELQRLAGPSIKWKASSPAGPITFGFATNPKTAGLLPNLPGEFRLQVAWRHRRESQMVSDNVSWFQYATEVDHQAFADLQRAVLEKFLAQPGKEPLRLLFNYTTDRKWLPRANFDEFSYYLCAGDASSWGIWYASRVDEWCARFESAPESYNAWCERVLWADPRTENEA